MTGLFLSDLHLFSRRSIGQRHWDQNTDAIAAATSIVLGGDMFDFRWSQPGSLDASLDAAAAWLEKAIALNPPASWVYLPGNHDCHPRMQALLSSISDKYPTFDWSPTFWRIGSNVFRHGDVLVPEVRNIFFGHTHVPMQGYRFDRFDFHNSGSGIRYSTFTPASFELP